MAGISLTGINFKEEKRKFVIPFFFCFSCGLSPSLSTISKSLEARTFPRVLARISHSRTLSNYKLRCPGGIRVDGAEHKRSIQRKVINI